MVKAEDIQIKHLGHDDVDSFRSLVSLFCEVFGEETPAAGEVYLKSLLARPGFNVFVVIKGAEIAGGLTAFELPIYYSEASEMFIYDIVVKPLFQRKGIGKKQLIALEEYCGEKGIKQIFVAANKEDAHALDFYHSAGGEAEEVVHFNYVVGD